MRINEETREDFILTGLLMLTLEQHKNQIPVGVFDFIWRNYSFFLDCCSFLFTVASRLKNRHI